MDNLTPEIQKLDSWNFWIFMRNQKSKISFLFVLSFDLFYIFYGKLSEFHLLWLRAMNQKLVFYSSAY